MRCIDVSQHNGTIDWKKVKADGVSNVIIKAIKKDNNADPKFETNYAGAKAQNFNIGVYNYSYAKTTAEAAVAANALLKQIKGKNVNLGVWLDVEDNCQKNMGRLLIDIINTYGYIIKQAGYKFGIYTGLSFYNSYMKPYANELNYQFWIARYPSSTSMTIKDNPPADKKPNIGKVIWGWQYTSKGRVSGISGNVDISEISIANVAPTVTNSNVYIGHASIDEHGEITGGTAGDQTGKEVCIRTWYSKPWIAVYRPVDPVKAEKIALTMEQACANDNIGYNQKDRLSLYNLAKAKAWNMATVSLCNCDCSSLVMVCCNAAGIPISKSMYTGNEDQLLMNSKEFTRITDSSVLTTSSKLRRGDILLGKGHTAIVLTNGLDSGVSNTILPGANKLEEPTHANAAAAGVYEAISNLRLRYGAGTNKEMICIMPKGSRVLFFGRYTPVDNVAWCYVVYNNLVGFCSIEYLKKI